jgi:hypothetical protein
LSYFTIAHNANFHNYGPDVAYSPAHDTVITGSDIWGRRVSWHGNWMGSEFALGRPAKAGKQHNAAVTYNPVADEYAVVWQNSSGGSHDIDARRLAADGTPLGPSGGLWVTANPGRHDYAPRVACEDGYGYLIAWQRCIDYNVYGCDAMPDRDYGIGPEFALDDDVAAQMEPAVACRTLGNCLMAEEDSNSAGADFEIRGRLVWLHHVHLPLAMRNTP